MRLRQESRTHIVGECGLYKEERNMLEKERRKIDGCGMKTFGTLYSSEKTIVIQMVATHGQRGRK